MARAFTSFAAAWALALLAGPVCAQPAAASAQPAAASAQAVPLRRVLPADVEPVYRGPSVDTLATVRKRGRLRVGVVAVEPMVMFDAKGGLAGYSIDLARRLADDIGVGVDFVPTSWVSVIPDLLEHQFDVIVTGLWMTAPRALVVNYSVPTAVEGVHLIASRSRAGRASTLADYNQAGITLAVFADTVQEQLARRHFPQATLLRVSEGDELAPVRDGRAHAALVPSLAPEALVARDADGLYLPLARPIARTSTALAIRKGDADFLNFLNTWIELQREQGWLEERARHWATPGVVP